MDKKTILAILISVVIYLGVTVTVRTFFPGKQRETNISKTEEKTTVVENTEPIEQKEEKREKKWNCIITPLENDRKEKDIEIETDVYKIVFSNKGGTVKSIELKNYKLNSGKNVEMVFGGSPDNKAFNLYFGSQKNRPIEAIFDYSTKGNQYIFTKKFESYERGNEEEKNLFLLKKVFTIKPEEYLIQLDVYFENENRQKSLPLDRENLSYTLGFEPQIGPEFKKIGGRGKDYRKNYTYFDGKKKRQKIGKGKKTKVVDESFFWAGITGKYFSVIGIPYVDSLEKITFSKNKIKDIPEGAQFYFSINAERKKHLIDDRYYFYVGPRKESILKKYNKEKDNSFGVKDFNINKIVDTGWPIFGWLEIIIKELLKLFYRIIPNYGISIIFTTILIKALVFPLTHKTFESTTKMQALQPKMEEIRNKYKNDPQKMNMEIAAFYKKEGVNPLGGCLPMLLQMPIMIAFYGLLNNHFDLRGAPFVGWITDLSSPESIFTLSFEIPFGIGSEIRLLPLIMVATQILSGKIMQTSNTSANNQMKMMSYAMPVVFLFILYNLPSGLIIYWTVANIITVLQQFIINKILKNRAS